MDQTQAFLQAMYQAMMAARDVDDSAGETSVGHSPQGVIPGEYIHGWHTNRGSNYERNPSSSTLVSVSESPTLARVHFQDPDRKVNPANSGWYDLITPPICQGCSAVCDKQKKEWSCSGCGTTFKAKYEATRHINTAGMEVRCRYCDEVVNGTPFVLKRHVEGNTRCQRRWEKRGFTEERTVDGAFRA